LIFDRSCMPHADHNCTTSEAAIPSITSINDSQAAGTSAAVAICKINYLKPSANKHADNAKNTSAYLHTINCCFYKMFWRLGMRELRQSVALQRPGG
jgi:hypothetical protein